MSIKRVKDVDVFCRLKSLPEDYDPVKLLNHTKAVLDEAFPPIDGESRTQIQGRSVKVTFPAFDMHVDAVPARKAGGVWEIPCKDPGDGWDKTNPEEFTELSSRRNDTYGDNYVPVVKLVRQTRRALLGRAKPGGLFVEVAAYHAFAQHPAPGSSGAYTSVAAYYANTLRVMVDIISAHVDGTEPMENPALPGEELRVRATDAEWVNLKVRWADAADRAMAALNHDSNCMAAKIFRDLLGQDSLGDWVFPMPGDCNADGTTRAEAIKPGSTGLTTGATPTFG